MKNTRHRLTAWLVALGLTAILIGTAFFEGTVPAQDLRGSHASPEDLTSQRAALVLPAWTGRTKVTPGAKLTGPAATRVLKALPVKGKAPATGYQRNVKFGNGFKDFNHNKCDERQDTLKRDMSRVKYKDRKHCQVASGRLNDAYTGRAINWKVKAGSVDIDHVVALKNAWISGGRKLSPKQRQALANDPLNLMASAASANRSKGDRNAAEWLPANKRFRCQYVATQISVKHKYALAVTSAEKSGMSRVLRSCPKQRAAKVTPIKPAGTPSTTARKPAAKKSAKTATRRVHPGAFCSPRGAKGVGRSNGKIYTCKTSTTDTRARWRR
ncbi:MULTISPECIES: HNH endonuclease family protein [Micrococcaceae]|uniref:HNH endonuclease family protein n=1 Tax=Micrococcaceae TaxID=1268 RepID=UPI001F530E06|nr:HNH endonuclease family protein [Glutamicibacter sp. BW78]